MPASLYFDTMLFGNKEYKNFNPRDTFIGAIVVALIAGIFFVPELARLVKRSMNQDGSKKVEIVAENQEKETTQTTNKVKTKLKSEVTKNSSDQGSSDQAQSDQKQDLKAALKNSDNPLDQVLYKFDKNRYNTQQKILETQEKVETKSKKAPVSFFDRLFGRSKGNVGEKSSGAKEPSVYGKKKKDPQKELEKIFSSGEVTWKTLKLKEVATAIKEAQKKAVTIAKQLDTSSETSIQALDKYIKSLYKLQSGAFENFKAKDVVTFIATVDMNVTRALAKDKINRGIYVQWLQVGLDPMLRSTEAPQLKRQLLPVFRVDVLLTKVRAYDVIRKNKYTKRVERVKSGISVSGEIKGSDATELEIFQNTELLRRIKLKFNKKNLDKPKKFSFRYYNTGDKNSLASNFVIRVKDATGNYYQKLYRFDPRIRNFKQSKAGHFLLPRMDSLTIHKTRALDRYFVAGESGTDIEGGFGGVFQGGRNSGFSGGFDSFSGGIEGLSSF